jgi:hypothetical protein
MSDKHAFDESIPVLTEVVAEEAAQAEAAAAAAAAAAADVAIAADEADSGVVDTIDAPGPAVGAASPSLPSLPSLPSMQPMPPLQPLPVVRELDDAAWQTLEDHLIARVLDRLQERIALVLEDQVRSNMAPVLEHVIGRIGADLHAGLQHTVEQVVARAVSEELEHLKSRGEAG